MAASGSSIHASIAVCRVLLSVGVLLKSVDDVSSTVELLVTLVELREMTSLPDESCMALASSLADGSV